MQTAVEEIISEKVGRSVKAGETIEALPLDKLFLNEVIAPSAIIAFRKDFEDVFKENGKTERVFDAKKVFFFASHSVPSCSIRVQKGMKMMREFAKEKGMKMFGSGDGIEHAIMPEEGLALPGEIIAGTDSHTCTQGATGAFAFGIGTTDASCALATGDIYNFVVPETIGFEISGNLGKGVYAKDLILGIIAKMGAGGCSKKVAEFFGETIEETSMEGRLTICNMAVEMGARTGMMEADEKTYNYIGKQGARTAEKEGMKKKGTGKGKADEKTSMKNGREAKDETGTDSAKHFHKKIGIDASAIEPMVAFPHSPANGREVSKAEGIEVDKAYIGSCTNGRKEDLEIGASVLKGKKVAKNTELIVIPASRRIYEWAMDNGILQVYAKAGANIESANCGPCFGKHMGLLAEGERCISSSNRNYIGRMGSENAEIYLASPATVAASAIEGKIADPRKYI